MTQPRTTSEPSVAAPRRIYAYTRRRQGHRAWERTVGATTVTGNGLIKVGETTKADRSERIKEQLGTAYPDLDGRRRSSSTSPPQRRRHRFRDHDVHRVLDAAGIQRHGGEWFEATLDEVRAAIVAVRTARLRPDAHRRLPACVRSRRTRSQLTAALLPRARRRRAPAAEVPVERQDAVRQDLHRLPARPRDGLEAVLVLTYKPAVQTHGGTTCSATSTSRAGSSSTGTPRRRARRAADGPDRWSGSPRSRTSSGKTADGDIKDHNETIHLIDWDCIVLDEYHFGAWRDSARELYDPTDKALAEDEEPEEWVTEEDLGLDAEHFLYLSGTPFRAITNGEFTEDQIFNWTYVDEQRGEGTLGRRRRPEPLRRPARHADVRLRDGRRAPQAGPRTASSTASP